MRNLKKYVDQSNEWDAIFGKPEMVYPLDQDGVTRVANCLDGEMSPENLHCDGEISHRQAQAKANFYYAVFDELKAYAEKSGLIIPLTYYFKGE